MNAVPRKLMLLAVGMLATVAAVRVAHAHALDIAYLRIEPPANGSAPATVVLDIDIGAAALLLGVKRDDVTAEYLGAHTQDLAQLSFAKEQPSSSGPCTLGAPKAELAPPSIRVSATLVCPPGARKWSFSFVTDARIPATFQLLVKDVASDQLTVVDRASPLVELPEPKPAAVQPPLPKPIPTGKMKLLAGVAMALVAVLVIVLVSRRADA